VLKQSLLLIAIVFAAGCSQHRVCPSVKDLTKDPAWKEQSTMVREAKETAYSLWLEHWATLSRAAKGKKFRLEDFGAAYEFFGDLTGVYPTQNLSAFGPLPDQNLEDSMMLIGQWFVECGFYVTWSQDSQRVVLESDAPKTCSSGEPAPSNSLLNLTDRPVTPLADFSR
jgi:hypothetical protein